MACFTAPLIEAVVVGVAKKGVEKKEKKEGTEESGTSGKKLITVIYLIICIAAIIFVGLGERLLPASEHSYSSDTILTPDPNDK